MPIWWNCVKADFVTSADPQLRTGREVQHFQLLRGYYRQKPQLHWKQSTLDTYLLWRRRRLNVVPTILQSYYTCHLLHQAEEVSLGSAVWGQQCSGLKRLYDTQARKKATQIASDSIHNRCGFFQRLPFGLRYAKYTNIHDRLSQGQLHSHCSIIISDSYIFYF